MKIAAAQIFATVGKIDENLAQHERMIKLATEQGVRLIAFPEMSITGYCREQGRELAFSKNDARLIALQKLATQHQIIIIAGAPIALADKLYIGSFVIQPHKEILIYSKQYLHAGEEQFYDASFAYNPILALADETISLAICADIDHPAHAAAAHQNGISLYVPSIFFSEGGIDKGHQLLAQYAKQHAFSILMSNYCGEHWNTKSGGKSGFWDSDGNLLGTLDRDESGLLIVEKQQQIWSQIRSLPSQIR